MRIIVTGDSGFFGKHIVKALLAKGFEVVGLSPSHETHDYETVDFDITSGVPEIDDIHSIIHLAADVTGSTQSEAVNVLGTKNMLELAKKSRAKSFVFASTGGVYGYGDTPFTETDEVRVWNEYTRTKHKAELLCKEYSKYFNVTILRYFFPYGPAESSARLMNRLVKNIYEGTSVELNNHGKPVVNPIFINDAVDVTLRAIEAKGFDIFNVAGDEEVSILDIVKVIERQTGKKAHIRYNGKDSSNMIGDISKAKQILGFKPRTNLEKGISFLMQ